MDYSQIINKLKSLKNPKNIEGMARFGINPKYALGINIPVLRNLAKEIEKIDNKSARWIAKDALKELSKEKLQKKSR